MITIDYPNAEFLIMVAGMILSLLFSYIPKLNTWYAVLQKEYKQLIMLGAVLVVTGGIYGLGCAQIIQIPTFECTQNTAWDFIKLFMTCVISNQVTYRVTPQTESVRELLFLPIKGP